MGDESKQMNHKLTPSSNVSHDVSDLIIKERSKIVNNLNEQLYPSLSLSYLKYYKDNLFRKNTALANNILEELEELIATGINIARQYINNLRSEKTKIISDKKNTQINKRVNWQKKIARDLHDTLLQNLTTLYFEIQFCKQLLKIDYPKAQAEYSCLKNLFIDYFQEINKFAIRTKRKNFRSHLVRMIKTYIKKYSSLYNIDVQISNTGSEKHISLEIKDNIFQIVKEALINVRKHAQATQVIINIIFDRKCLKMSIEDNGRGFILNNIDNEFFGIRGMKERVFLFNGNFKIKTFPGNGTKILINIPIESKH